MNTKKYLITIVGPTAIGKTGLAIQLANYYNTVIISADSRQCYKEMSIGTAVPSKEELAKARHYFIQYKSILKSYSVGHYEQDAIKKLQILFKKHDILILVGGSGLYIDAVLNGLDNFPDVDPKIREHLKIIYNTEGIIPLQNQLREKDPDYFKAADIYNPQRVIRALEICMTAQQPYSSFLRKKNIIRNFTPIIIGLYADRKHLYERIHQRVDIMMQKGLLAEASQLYPYKAYQALQTVGYKELFSFFDGKYSLETAVSEIKKHTRRYAKRQLTWFKRYNTTLWYPHTTCSGVIIDDIQKHITN